MNRILVEIEKLKKDVAQLKRRSLAPQNSVVRIDNNTGSQIDAGSVVYISGINSGRPEVSLADKNNVAHATGTLGVIPYDIVDTGSGYVMSTGYVRDIDTSSFAVGDTLYLGAGGALTDVKPSSPDVVVNIGVCIVSDATNGVIYVKPKLLTDLGMQMVMDGNSIATATSLTVRAILPSVAADLGWIVIDPGTSDCEIREVTSVTNQTLGWVGGLTYAHADGDPVLWVTDPQVNLRWFGAVGDGSTNDTLAFQRACVQGMLIGNLFIPEGVYDLDAMGSAVNITSPLTVTGRGTLQGTTECFNLQASFSVTGITFTGWATAMESTSALVSRFVAENNTFDSCDYGIDLNVTDLDSAFVNNNVFTTLTKWAIRIGSDTKADQPDIKGIIVTNNQIDDVDGGSDTEVHGIFIFGTDAIIENNVVRNVTSTTDTDIEGIYAKIMYGSISNNILTDAGRNQGSIVIKGEARDGTGGGVTSNKGWSIRIQNNIIRRVSGTSVRGILAQCDDVLISGNLIEACDVYGISAYYGNNTTISDNDIILHEGNIAIYANSTEDRINMSILNNRISGLYVATGSAYGILLNATVSGKDYDGVRIEGNQIDDILSDDSTEYGIRINLANGTNTDFSICNNHIRDLTVGLNFTGTGVPDRVIIANNRFIDCTTDIQYTATPTNLIDRDNDSLP